MIYKEGQTPNQLIKVNSMNVMAQAHKDTKEYMIERAIQKPNSAALLTYRQVFSAMLRNCHWHYKNTQKTIKLSTICATLEEDADATSFSLEGTAIDSEGNKVYIGESGSSIGVQAAADWYFSRSNGFTSINLQICVWGLEDVKESFKVIR